MKESSRDVGRSVLIIDPNMPLSEVKIRKAFQDYKNNIFDSKFRKTKGYPTLELEETTEEMTNIFFNQEMTPECVKKEIIKCREKVGLTV